MVKDAYNLLSDLSHYDDSTFDKLILNKVVLLKVFMFAENFLIIVCLRKIIFWLESFIKWLGVVSAFNNTTKVCVHQVKKLGVIWMTCE